MQYVFQELLSPASLGNSTEIIPSITTLAIMVSISFFRLISLLVSASPLALSAPAAQTKAEVAFNTLQSWYNKGNGLWDTTGWWNSANCLTTIGDLAAIDNTVSSTVQNVFSNTFTQAQKYNLQMAKVVTADYNIVSYYGSSGPSAMATEAYDPKGFLNGYYDDEGVCKLPEHLFPDSNTPRAFILVFSSRSPEIFRRGIETREAP